MKLQKPSPRGWCALAICFLLQNAIVLADNPELKNVHQRSEFQNSRIQFEQGGSGHVAFMGGSITEMNGYRPLLMAYLEKKFPTTKFKFTDAGISSTCSTAGAFRLQNDVLSRGQVDLFFIEFAVNDDQDAMHSLESSLRGMEGIIRRTLSHSPHADIVITYFVNEGMLEKLQRGETPVSIAAHEKVAKHYGITSVHLAQEVADRIDEWTLTWKQYGGVHPASHGNAIPASMISQTLDRVWDEPLKLPATPAAIRIPKALDRFSYVNGQYLSDAQIEFNEGWKKTVPDWKDVRGSVRARHQMLPLYVSETPDAELVLSFRGNAFGVECVAGPDAGTLLYSVDEGDWQEYNLAHRFSNRLHYPRTVVLAGELEDKQHSVRLKLANRESNYERPPAARILNFVVNANDE